MTDAVIVSTARTGLAKSWKGAFNMTHGATLGGHSVKHAVARAGLDPAEVEDVLMRHPAVARAGACGVPDALQGELLAAFVILAPGAAATSDDLVAHCKAVASRYKVPDFVVIRETLPVTVTGKLMRRELKPMAAGLVG